ncbi:MAG: peptidylprolyl isomerase [Bradyrhizobiaceae bacterium]|nr:peptidylprolyl isomerase [Hyphomicrobiales bacterium]MBV9427715.1 peptidylprolyl isomerase [Bradyrhizobiaceae bacterium]
MHSLLRPLVRTRLFPLASGALALLAVIVLALAFGLRADAQNADQIVARVNGADIKASDVAIAEEDIGANLSQIPPESRREYLTSYLTDMSLVAKAAEGRNLADGEAFKQRLAYYRSKILMDLLLQSEAKAAVSDAAMHQLYDEAAKQMAGQQEVRARHILVKTEDEAKAVIAELKNGADFAELAKKKSTDPGASEGGDLGYFPKDEMVPEFAEAAFKLEKGQISEPVHTRFGWHVIKVEDKRERQVPTFDQVREQLATHLVRKAQAELITKLRADAKVERLDQPVAQPAQPAQPVQPVQPAKP